eukprot:m.359674 g.359674  ORF g.359674 m.359674 type:complete len:91 (+) comp18665_c0_seq1:118-390(+)
MWITVLHAIYFGHSPKHSTMRREVVAVLLTDVGVEQGVHLVALPRQVGPCGTVKMVEANEHRRGVVDLAPYQVEEVDHVAPFQDEEVDHV